MKLYRGLAVTVRSPNIQKEHKATDFGKGLYTATSSEQTKKWTVLKRNREHDKETAVSIYEIPDNTLDREFSVFRLGGATKEWLEFIVSNHRGKGKGSYDSTAEPVANDQLYATIRLYEQGVVMADAVIETLKTHKFFSQLSFHTVEVIPLLKFTESTEV